MRRLINPPNKLVTLNFPCCFPCYFPLFIFLLFNNACLCSLLQAMLATSSLFIACYVINAAYALFYIGMKHCYVSFTIHNSILSLSLSLSLLIFFLIFNIVVLNTNKLVFLNSNRLIRLASVISEYKGIKRFPSVFLIRV